MFYTGLYRGNMKKNLLVCNYKAYGLDIWYVASPSGPLPGLFKIWPWVQKWARPWGHMFYIGLYRENMEKSSCPQPQGLEP